MNYPFILKFSSITNLSDARYAAGMWADFIGFCFDPSKPEYLEPSKAKEIAGWINGPLITGEFGNQPIEWIQDFVKALDLKVVQVPATFQGDVASLGLKLIATVESEVQTGIMAKADMLITSDENIYKFLKAHYTQPVLMMLDEHYINADQFDGIALKGAMEDKPGTRNHSLWNEILEPYAG